MISPFPISASTPGWSAAFGMLSPFALNWVVSGLGGQGVQNPFVAPTDGTTVSYGARSGVIDPPKR